MGILLWIVNTYKLNSFYRKYFKNLLKIGWKCDKYHRIKVMKLLYWSWTWLLFWSKLFNLCSEQTIGDYGTQSYETHKFEFVGPPKETLVVFFFQDYRYEKDNIEWSKLGISKTFFIYPPSIKPRFLCPKLLFSQSGVFPNVHLLRKLN
jgi:hypothetical protein